MFTMQYIDDIPAFFQNAINDNRSINPTFRSAACGAEIRRSFRTPPCRPFRNTVETQCIASLHGRHHFAEGNYKH
ncbi:hypothetical protein Barb4_05101 [Bacteroidales bacterium Barb4]|nr:hypothetical protein Barb4_05101 [Bacteroidales bacterium Barb4]